MMEENNDIFLAGGDALVHLAGPMYKKIFHNICLGPSIWHVRILGPILQAPFLLPAFRVTVTAVGLFQKNILNSIAHMF